MQPTKQMTTDEKLVAIIKSRIFEIKANLDKVKYADEAEMLQNALNNNCTWLLSMGGSLDEVGVKL